jgi:hypothetical protein
MDVLERNLIGKYSELMIWQKLLENRIYATMKVFKKS